MAVTNFHGPHGVLVDSIPIGGITQVGVTLGTQLRNDATSGEVYNRFSSVQTQTPGATFATYQVGTAIDATGVIGYDVSSGAGLALYGVKHQLGGTRATGNVNAKYSISDGILSPTRLSVSDKGDATLAYECAALHEPAGANDPIVPTFVNAPLSLTDALRFTLGPVTIESVSLSQVTGVEIDFGINVVRRPADSEIWDTYASIETIQPVITLRGTLVTWFGSGGVDHDGLAITHANTTIYLKKRAAGGTYVANGTAQHIKLTAEGLATVQQCFDGSGEVIISIPCHYDGTNAPIVFDTASTIT